MLPGETPEETVVREIYEETGLQITISTLLGMWCRHVTFLYTLYPTANSPGIGPFCNRIFTVQSPDRYSVRNILV